MCDVAQRGVSPRDDPYAIPLGTEALSFSGRAHVPAAEKAVKRHVD